jgi:hypothetical protein
VKIQPQWVVTTGKQTNNYKHKSQDFIRNSSDRFNTKPSPKAHDNQTRAEQGIAAVRILCEPLQ